MNKKLALKGIAASPGIAIGKVRLLFSDSNATNFLDGEILVTIITDPTMILTMSKASAIVCDIGGITSHPSIVSREMGIPCVVNTKIATATLKNGQTIMVDGEKGEVYVMD